jgi:hypothetical protein
MFKLATCFDHSVDLEAIKLYKSAKELQCTGLCHLIKISAACVRLFKNRINVKILFCSW